MSRSGGITASSHRACALLYRLALPDDSVFLESYFTKGDYSVGSNLNWHRFTIPFGLTLLFFTTAGWKAQPLPQQPSPQVDVKIDNFTYSPTQHHHRPGHHRQVDQSRRYSPHRRQRRQKHLQVQGTRHRRFLLLHLYEARNLHLLLLHPSQNDRQGRRSIRTGHESF